MNQKLKKYDPNCVCVKCGNTSVRSLFQSQGRVGLFSGKLKQIPDEYLDGSCCLIDLILRSCERCSYVWYESPIDSLSIDDKEEVNP